MSRFVCQSRGFDEEAYIVSELTLKEVLELAIKKEEQSIEIYSFAQTKVLNPSSKAFLKELIEQEKEHKSKILEAMRDPGKAREIGSLDAEIQDLKIVDYLKEVSLSPEADYQQILIYAGKREKETHNLYLGLAKKCKDKRIGKMFTKLAQEELAHKYRLEQEYDDVILEWM